MLVTGAECGVRGWNPARWRTAACPDSALRGVDVMIGERPFNVGVEASANPNGSA